MHIYAGQIPVIEEEAKDPSHILGYAEIRGFEHQYIQWFIIYCPHIYIYTHTHILAVSTIKHTQMLILNMVLLITDYWLLITDT